MSCGASSTGTSHVIRSANRRRKVARRHLWQAAGSMQPACRFPRLEELVSFLLAAREAFIYHVIGTGLD